MTDLATRLAPHLTGVLIHPGDGDTKPFPLAPLAVFQTATLPPGMAEELAEQAGLPSPDFARIWLEAVLHLVETEGGVELVDKTELADLRAAAASVEHQRVRHVDLVCRCDTKLGRVSVRDFDTDRAQVNGPELIKALGSMSPGCAGGHKR